MQISQGTQIAMTLTTLLMIVALAMATPCNEEGRVLQLLSRALCQNPLHIKLGTAHTPMSLLLRTVI